MPGRAGACARAQGCRGDRSAALAAYARCREVLGRELGVRPGHETVQLAELIEASGALSQPAPSARPIATLRPPRLVGREAEWRSLQHALETHRHVIVSGEPGSGKSRLLGDFAAAQSGALHEGARAGDANLPYALLSRIVRGLAQRYRAPPEAWVRAELARIAPELGAPAASNFERLRLQQAVESALCGWQRAGLCAVMVDDLQIADEATLDLLPGLAAGASGVTWICSVRCGAVPARVAAWLDAGDAAAPRRVTLGALDSASIAALLDSLALPGLVAARWAAPLARHAGGNPMFLLETLIALIERDPAALAGAPIDLPAPPQVVRLIEQRLAQLTPAALKLARLVALAGRDFSFALAGEVLGLHALDIADHWRELEAAAVMRDGAFAHDLIFETTVRSVPQPIARALRREVALRLAERGAPLGRIALPEGNPVLAAP